MNEHHRTRLEENAPMVLRRVPPERRHLARAMITPVVEAAAGRWWEWADAAADGDLPAAAVALTAVEDGGGVVVSALGVRHADAEDAEDAYDELLQALLATLRRSGVDRVVMPTRERGVVRALLAAGFGPDPDVADRYVIAL